MYIGEDFTDATVCRVSMWADLWDGSAQWSTAPVLRNCDAALSDAFKRSTNYHLATGSGAKEIALHVCVGLHYPDASTTPFWRTCVESYRHGLGSKAYNL
ncbi:hypothetical protein GCM10023107_00930 [Actinoplanes octamycinicus]|nr:hypothetical protein Aoc01nite_92220 [Actinoplanes octamycinicus]